jgi:HK97 family phage portal protein
MMLNLGARWNLQNRGDTSPLDPRRGQAYWISPPYIPDGLQLSPHQVFEVGAVWACVSLIANSIASAPWYVLDVDADGKRTKVPPGDSLSWMLNTSPNSEQIAQSVKESLVAQALVFGNGYAEIVPDGARRTRELWPLLSERMWLPTRTPVVKDSDGNYVSGGELVYDYMNPDGGQIRMPAARVFHLRGPSLDGLMGAGTVTAAMKAITTAAAKDRYSAAYFANAATPSLLIEVPKVLQPKERTDLRAEIEAKYAGSKNNGRPFVLEGGAKITPVSNNPSEAQLVPGQQHSLEEIARYFGVPLHFLASPQGAQGYGRNLSELGHALINFGLKPWTRRLEQEAQIKLIGPRSTRVTVIDLSELSRGTAKETAEADEIRIRSGVFTINEVREKEGLNHGPSQLDEHLILTTYQTVERAVDPPEPPAPALPAKGGGQTSGDDTPGAGQLGTAPADSIRDAFVALLGRELDRYAKKLANRRADVLRRAPATVDQALEAARASFRPALVEDCAGAAMALKPAGGPVVGPDLILRMADAVEQGEPPTLAAERLLTMEAAHG